MRIILALNLLCALVFSAFAQTHFAPSDSPDVTITVQGAATGSVFFAASGNDNNACTQAAPCQTLGKAQSLVYQPGATINFNGGDNFTGCWVLSPANVSGRGDKNNPIIVQSYGNGRATWTSNCSAPSQGYMSVLDIVGVNGITVQNLILRQGAGFAANVGILIEGPGDTITIQDMDISGFVGPDDATPGAQIEIVGLGAQNGGGCNPLNNIKVLRSVLHGDAPDSRTSNGIYGFGCGQNITNVVYSNNHVFNMGGVPAGFLTNGIVITAVQGGLAEHNLIHDIGARNTNCGGPSGILVGADSVTIRFNEVYNVRPSNFNQGGCDWDAYDLDIGTTNSVVEYNYAHDNAGPCLLEFGAPGPNIYRYNVCENNNLISEAIGGGGQISLNPSTVQVYNNSVFMRAETHPGEPPSCIFMGFSGSYGPGSLVENNICDVLATSEFNVTSGIANGGADASGVTFRNNLYSSNINNFNYGDGQLPSLQAAQAAGKDLGSIQGDPLYTGAGTGGVCGNAVLSTGPQPCPSGYQLQGNSPALHAGTNVPNNGGRDYYGNSIGSPPNIGAF
jgi:hypothetical protein